MSSTYTTISNAGFYEVLREDAEAGETSWTVNKNVKRGDTILLYICKPVSGIVATAEASTNPEIDDDPSSDWFNHYLVDMHNLRMLNTPLRRETLLAKFSEWRYWKQPHNSVAVPPIHLPRLKELIVASQDSSLKSVCECGDYDTDHTEDGHCKICRWNPNPYTCKKYRFVYQERNDSYLTMAQATKSGDSPPQP